MVVGLELLRGISLLEDPEEEKEKDRAKQNLGKSRSTITDLFLQTKADCQGKYSGEFCAGGLATIKSILVAPEGSCYA